MAASRSGTGVTTSWPGRSGCRAEWVAEVLAACRRFGDAPVGRDSGLGPVLGPFAERPPGDRGGRASRFADDRGRPGALAFHALLVEPRRLPQGRREPIRVRRGDPSPVVARHHPRTAIHWTVDTRSTSASVPDRPPSPADRRGNLAKGRRESRSNRPSRSTRWPGVVWPSLPGSDPSQKLGGDLGVRQRQPVRPRRPPSTGRCRA